MVRIEPIQLSGGDRHFRGASLIKPRHSVIAGSLLAVSILVGLGFWFGPGLVATNRVVSVYSRLLMASFDGDLNKVRSLCSKRYLAGHRLELAPEGGVIGFPRGIHKNFKVWMNGGNVWLCPTNRIGPVYQFVREGGNWKFDGPVGLLRSGGELLPVMDNGNDLTGSLP